MSDMKEVRINFKGTCFLRCSKKECIDAILKEKGLDTSKRITSRKDITRDEHIFTEHDY